MRTPARQTALQATSCAALLLALLAAACVRAGAIADVGAGTGWIRIDDIVAVRLAGGPSEREGVLQVQGGNGTWYSGICTGDDLDRGQIAVVVCRQLGFGDHGQPAYGLGSLPTNGTAFSGPSLYGEAECTGEEAKLGECLFYLYASSDPHCNNPNDLPIDYRSFTLGAICPGGIDVRGLRLAPGSGTQPGEGLLEAQLADGSWGAVMADWSWFSFQELAEVACRELGYGDGPALFRGDGFFNAGGTAAAGVNVVACNSSTASRLADCELTRPLQSSSPVGVACNVEYCQLRVACTP